MNCDYARRPHATRLAFLAVSSILLVLSTLCHGGFAGSVHATSSSEFVSVRNGHFWLNGHRLYLNGIYYYPEYSLQAAGKDPNTAAWWCYNLWTACDYRPAIVEGDLQRIHQAGFNLVAIPYPARMLDLQNNIVSYEATPQSQGNLKDFMSRARANGLFVMIGIGELWERSREEPIERIIDEYVSSIKSLDLLNDPTLLGYSLQGEINIGYRAFGFRSFLNPEWTKWVLNKYGSFDGARSKWGYSPYVISTSPLLISDPEDSQLGSEGEWSKFTADYWAFIYDWTNNCFNLIVQAIKKIDPNHLITIENGNGGSGNLGKQQLARVPPDLSMGADFLDFLSPEGYAIPPPWDVAPTWYGHQVAGVYCKEAPQGYCNSLQTAWDNPSDQGLDIMFISQAFSDYTDPSHWPAPAPFTPSPGTVSGRVFRGDNGQPLANVKMIFGQDTEPEVYTDANGYYQAPFKPGDGYCVDLADPQPILQQGRYDLLAINASPSLYEEYTKTTLAWFGFINSYARWATAYSKPVVWLENGRSLGLYPLAKTLEEQKLLWQDFLTAALEYDSDGFIAWWYPGGPRQDEGTDYGLFNTDGSPRPTIQAFQTYFSQLGIYKPRPIDTLLEVEHGGQNPRGFGGAMAKHISDFDQLLRDGKKPAVTYTIPHSPTIVLSPNVGSGFQATKVAVTGSGWSGQDVSVTLQVTSSPSDGEPWNTPATFTCGISNRTIMTGCSFTVKPDASGGFYIVKATGARGDWSVAVFMVGMKMDGSEAKWNGIRPIVTDASGDAKTEGTDIREVYGVMDDEYLYLMLKTAGPIDKQAAFLFDLDTNNDAEIEYSVRLENNYTRLWNFNTDQTITESLQYGWGDVVEVKVPLLLIQNPVTIKVRALSITSNRLSRDNGLSDQTDWTQVMTSKVSTPSSQTAITPVTTVTSVTSTISSATAPPTLSIGWTQGIPLILLLCTATVVFILIMKFGKRKRKVA
jgi:hypothetical protein